MEREGELRPEFEKGYHTSGHASKGDLEWTIGEIDPDVIVPVHTTGQGLLIHYKKKHGVRSNKPRYHLKSKEPE